MKNTTIQPLFPIPVFSTEIGRFFTREELEIVKANEDKVLKNSFNHYSSNTSILELPELCDIKSFVEQALSEYLINVIKPATDVKLRITQSWLNYTYKNEAHHQHWHRNSFLSGVLYIITNPNTDKIHFYRHEYSQFYIETKEPTIWNSMSWWLEAKVGSLYIFPSMTNHGVEQIFSDIPRISLAFNTVPVGTLGSKSGLTQLVI